MLDTCNQASSWYSQWQLESAAFIPMYGLVAALRPMKQRSPCYSWSLGVCAMCRKPRAALVVQCVRDNKSLICAVRFAGELCGR